jgi:hypothetical protein
MAEINIQRKSNNALWWILAIVAVVIIAWMLFAWTGTGQQTPATFHEVPAGPFAASLLDGLRAG